MSERVVLVDPEGEGGLAAVLADLIRTNLEQHPDRARILDSMYGRVEITADDGTESVTAALDFREGRLSVSPGKIDCPDVRVKGGYEGILGLSTVPMCGLLPAIWKAPGWVLVDGMLKGRLDVTGMAFSPLLVLRLLALVSVG